METVLTSLHTLQVSLSKGTTCTNCMSNMVGRKKKRTNNRAMLPALKYNAAASYTNPVKIELLKGAGAFLLCQSGFNALATQAQKAKAKLGTCAYILIQEDIINLSYVLFLDNRLLLPAKTIDFS